MNGVTFFLDRQMSPQLPKLFAELGLQAKHHNDIFGPKTLDPEIIEYAARENLVLVTYDRRILRIHKEVLRVHCPRAVFLSKSLSIMKIADQVTWYRETWSRFATRQEVFQPMTQIRLLMDGRFRTLWPLADDDAETDSEEE